LLFSLLIVYTRVMGKSRQSKGDFANLKDAIVTALREKCPDVSYSSYSVDDIDAF